MADTDSLDLDALSAQLMAYCISPDLHDKIIAELRGLRSRLAEARESRERLRKWLSTCGEESNGMLAELRGLRSRLAESQRESAELREQLNQSCSCVGYLRWNES